MHSSLLLLEYPGSSAFHKGIGSIAPCQFGCNEKLNEKSPVLSESELTKKRQP